MSHSTLFFTLGSVSLVANVVTAEELNVEPEKENVVASRLEGNWVTHESLTQHLTGDANSSPAKISFKSDPSVAAKIPDEFAKLFTQHKMQIFLAGYLKLDDEKSPFVLTCIRGNPHVIYWLERNDDPFGNSESFNVMLAVADDQKNDLLFVGGDFNNQPFSAFERAKLQPKK